MPDRTNSAGIEPIVPRSAAYAEFAKALRLYVGRGCRYSYKEMQQKAGVPARMIEAYRYEPGDPEHRPAPFEHILSLAAAIGPEFTADWLKLADQGAFWLPDADEPPPGELAADNADDNAVITRAARDGKFDKHERPDLRTVGNRMITRGTQLAALAAVA